MWTNVFPIEIPTPGFFAAKPTQIHWFTRTEHEKQSSPDIYKRRRDGDRQPMWMRLI